MVRSMMANYDRIDEKVKDASFISMMVEEVV